MAKEFVYTRLHLADTNKIIIKEANWGKY